MVIEGRGLLVKRIFRQCHMYRQKERSLRREQESDNTVEREGNKRGDGSQD